jgi:hypothetical protein
MKNESSFPVGEHVAFLRRAFETGIEGNTASLDFCFIQRVN